MDSYFSQCMFKINIIPKISLPIKYVFNNTVLYRNPPHNCGREGFCAFTARNFIYFISLSLLCVHSKKEDVSAQL